jgi:hypothetical protein
MDLRYYFVLAVIYCKMDINVQCVTHILKLVPYTFTVRCTERMQEKCSDQCMAHPFPYGLVNRLGGWVTKQLVLACLVINCFAKLFVPYSPLTQKCMEGEDNVKIDYQLQKV